MHRAIGMNKNRFLTILPFIVWFPLYFLLWLTYQARGNWYYLFASLVPFFLVLVPIAIVKFVEKQNVIQRFGFQQSRLLIIASLPIVTFLAVAVFGRTINLWNSLYAVVLAPIPEEIFFRGYIQGFIQSRFTKKEPEVNVPTMNWKMAWVPILVSSTIFTVSHIFRYSDFTILFLFPAGLLYGLLFLMTKSILLSTAIHTGVNFISILDTTFFSQIQFVFWLDLIMLPAVLLSVSEIIDILRNRVSLRKKETQRQYY